MAPVYKLDGQLLYAELWRTIKAIQAPQLRRIQNGGVLSERDFRVERNWSMLEENREEIVLDTQRKKRISRSINGACVEKAYSMAYWRKSENFVLPKYNFASQASNEKQRGDLLHHLWAFNKESVEQPTNHSNNYIEGKHESIDCENAKSDLQQVESDSDRQGKRSYQNVRFRTQGKISTPNPWCAPRSCLQERIKYLFSLVWSQITLDPHDIDRYYELSLKIGTFLTFSTIFSSLFLFFTNY